MAGLGRQKSAVDHARPSAQDNEARCGVGPLVSALRTVGRVLRTVLLRLWQPVHRVPQVGVLADLCFPGQHKSTGLGVPRPVAPPDTLRWSRHYALVAREPRRALRAGALMKSSTALRASASSIWRGGCFMVQAQTGSNGPA